MKKLESTFLNMTIVMLVITLFSAGVLSYVNGATKDTISAQKQAKKDQAIKDVLPDNDKVDEAIVIENKNVYKAYLKGEFVGAAIQSDTISGYCSKIVVMVGYKADGAINTYSVLSQAETPGLGTKMVDWFKDKSSIIGLDMSDPKNLQVKKDKGNIDAITAATISSRAFLDAVKSTKEAFDAMSSETAIESVDTVQEVAPQAVPNTEIKDTTNAQGDF